MLKRIIIISIIAFNFVACNKVVLDDISDWQGDFFGASTNFFTDLNGKCANVVASSSSVFAVSNSANKMYMIDFSLPQPAVVSSLATQENPSRTTLDDKGRIWVGNRNSSSATCYIVNENSKLEYCFTSPHITTGGGPRTVTSERIDDNNTNVYIGAYDGNTYLTRIKVQGKIKPLTNQVARSSVKLLSNPSTEIKGYGGIFAKDMGLLWVAARADNKLVAINNLNSTPFAPKVAVEIDLSDICGGHIYGIGRTDVYQMPLGACIDGGFFQTVLNGDGSYTILKYDLGGKRTRGISGDINGNAWVSMDTLNKIAKIRLDESCADKKYILSCTASGAGQICKANGVQTRAPAAECVVEAPVTGATPLGVSADRNGNVYVVGYSNATMYRFKDNGASVNYDKSAKFSSGTAYMYSDFTGFTTGFVGSQVVRESKCFEKPIELIAAKYTKTDARNAIKVEYFCSDTQSATGDYKHLPSGDRLKDCAGKMCINVMVSFEASDIEEAQCATQLSAMALKYKLVDDTPTDTPTGGTD
jgi:streptogramin lyase